MEKLIMQKSKATSQKKNLILNKLKKCVLRVVLNLLYQQKIMDFNFGIVLIHLWQRTAVNNHNNMVVYQ